MADERFFRRHGPFTLGMVAERANVSLPPGAPCDLLLRGIASLESAGPDEASVFYDARHTQAFATSRAGAIITTAKLAAHPHNGACLVIARDPRSAFAAFGLVFHPRCVDEPGVSTTARIHPTAHIGEGCQIDAGAAIGANARIGNGCHINANAVIGASVELGEAVDVGSNATVTHALIGSHVRIGAGAVIGGEGFGIVLGPQGLMCSAQIGRVLIGDNVRVGGNCTIDRGASGDTVIGCGTMLDNLVQIGHNVQIGSNCIFAGQAGVAGSTKIGDNVMVGGQVAISDHLVVGSNVRIAGKSGVMRDIADGEIVAGYPAIAVRQWHRQNVILSRLGCKTKPDA